MPRYKLTIAYDGTSFSGWQKQEPPEQSEPRPSHEKGRAAGLVSDKEGRVALRTVQAVVEQAVREVVREPVLLQGASRTDAGVHARGQVAAFTCSSGDAKDEASRASGGWPESRGVDRLLRALNGKLPDDVLVREIEVVRDDFNPIGDCTSKGYAYTLHVGQTRAIWDRHFVQQVWQPLDLKLMQAAAAKFEGTHDFAAFAAARHGRQSTVRTIHACRVSEVAIPDESRVGADERRVRIDVSGNGFLYNMVRIIAGTLVEVGKGRIPAHGEGGIESILASGDRTKAGPTLPPDGLCLEWIRY